MTIGIQSPILCGPYRILDGLQVVPGAFEIMLKQADPREAFPGTIGAFALRGQTRHSTLEAVNGLVKATQPVE
jgi:hypothetical protein